MVQAEQAPIGAAVCESLSAAVCGWLTAPGTGVAPEQVVGWSATEWEQARWAIQVHGIAPLLQHAIEQGWDASPLPAQLRAYLAEQRRLNAARVALLLADLAEVLDACRAAGVELIPLKGAHLAPLIYPDPGLRPMGDLDLLVRPADEARAVAALERLGYRAMARSWKHLLLARPEALGPIVSRDGEHPDNPRSIDLHTWLGEQFWGLRYDLTADAWADSGPAELTGGTARLLHPTTLLHHLAVHASGNVIARWVRLVQLYDMALVAHDLHADDWGRIVAGAHARRQERLVYPALDLLNRSFPIVPADVLADLRAGIHPALLGRLDSSDLDTCSYCNTTPTTLGEKLCWFRPGLEQLRAMRHIALPDPDELASWYPGLARPTLLPLAYARYGAEMVGWAARRLLGGRRLAPRAKN